ncbi:MAG: hypothetical protein NTW07_03930, partial [candidate division Zixibacteria bacterium]|nr:hypothetical protein [candidate division Zixibacteria bacterium]
MQMVKMLLIACLLTALLAGCSEKQKEASRLEQEVRNQEESTATDTTSRESVTVAVDTPAVAAAVADASAIPPEAQPRITPQPMPPAPTGE